MYKLSKTVRGYMKNPETPFSYFLIFSPLLRLTWAVKLSAAMGGSFLLSPVTFPRRISLTDTFLMLKPTLSPGRASVRDSWCISTDFTSVVRLGGAKVTTMPGFRIPVSTRPTGTVPIPEREQRPNISSMSFSSSNNKIIWN